MLLRTNRRQRGLEYRILEQCICVSCLKVFFSVENIYIDSVVFVIATQKYKTRCHEPDDTVFYFI